MAINSPSHQATNNEGCVELHRDKHTEGEGQCGHLQHREQQRDNSAKAIEQPGCCATCHKGLDNRCHSICLRCYKGILANKAVGLIHNNHNTRYGSCRHYGAHKLPSLLLAGCGAEPVANLKVGDKATRHRECGADNATDNQRCNHTRLTLKAYRYEDKRRQDQGHKRHTRHGVRAHDGDSICCHSGEEEGDDEDNQQRHDGLEPVAQNAKLEEYQGGDKSSDDNRHNRLHRDILLCARLCRSRLLATKLVLSQRQCRLDDARLTNDADKACHSDATDADRSANLAEDALRGVKLRRVDAHSRERVADGRCIEHREQGVYQWDNNKPYECRATSDDKRILKADDVAEAEHRSRGVETEGELGICC